MMRLAMLLVGSDRVRQDIIAIPAADFRPDASNETGFGWLLERIAGVVARHPRKPDDWDQRLLALDEHPDHAAALAHTLLEVAAGGVIYLDNLETL